MLDKLYIELEKIGDIDGFTVEVEKYVDCLRVTWFDESHTDCCGGGTAGGVAVLRENENGGITEDGSDYVYADIKEAVQLIRDGVLETDVRSDKDYHGDEDEDEDEDDEWWDDDDDDDDSEC